MTQPKRTSNYVEPYVPLSKRGEYSIEIRGRDLEWGTLRIVCHNHPDFSRRRQALTLAMKGGGVKGKPTILMCTSGWRQTIIIFQMINYQNV